MITTNETRDLSIEGYEDNIMEDIHWDIIDEVENDIIIAAQEGLHSSLFSLNKKWDICELPRVVGYLELLGYEVSYLPHGPNQILIRW